MSIFEKEIRRLRISAGYIDYFVWALENRASIAWQEWNEIDVNENPEKAVESYKQYVEIITILASIIKYRESLRESTAEED